MKYHRRVYTKEYCSELFNQGNELANQGFSFKEIEKKLIPKSKGFSFVVEIFPEMRKQMFDLIIKCEDL